jgi:hypothetical protein
MRSARRIGYAAAAAAATATLVLGGCSTNYNGPSDPPNQQDRGTPPSSDSPSPLPSFQPSTANPRYNNQ